ncbi:MAG: AAA family ATPase [Alphaproteobacteria bacterium]|nr:AAA family ATPase [Alphaproteobacteria bacterium]
MKIESIKIKNFRTLYDVELKGIPPLAVFVGRNGSGKSTLFDVFAFLKDALRNNVTVALQKLGGYKQVASRGHGGQPIVLEIKFRASDMDGRYILEISNGENGPVVKNEYLDDGEHLFEFEEGQGFVQGYRGVPNFPAGEEVHTLTEEGVSGSWQLLHSPDILALKGFGQFKNFTGASALRSFIENWQIFDFHIDSARERAPVGVDEHLSEKGENLAVVVQNLYEKDRKTFDEILEKFKNRIPDISKVSTSVTADGHVLLHFQDGAFKDPFLARHVSDGTIKMFAYMVLLHDPKPHPFLCIEEPENQLYPDMLGALVGELRDYAKRGGQVFVSTHSPDMLNETEIEEAFLLKRIGGITGIEPLAANEQIKALIDGGDKLGWLWRQQLLTQEI